MAYVTSPRSKCKRWVKRQGHSIRFGQTEHALRDVAENEVRADRGDARDQNLPQAALDVIEMTPIDRLPRTVPARIGHHGRRATLIFRLAPSAARL